MKKKIPVPISYATCCRGYTGGYVCVEVKGVGLKW